MSKMEKMSLRDIGLMYDEQFIRKMKIAKFLLKNLSSKKEAQIAVKWLARVSNIKSTVLEVKKNRNAFLSYMVKILRDAVLSKCVDSDGDTVCDPDNSLAFLDNPEDLSDITTPEGSDTTLKPKKKLQFHSKWSSDYRTYVALKPIPGRGALVYMATSKKSGLQNWDLPCLKKSSE